MNLPKPQRNRNSFFLTSEAIDLLERRRTQVAQDQGKLFLSSGDLQRLVQLTTSDNLDRKIISNIFEQKKRAERHSIQLLFSVLKLELKEEYLTRTLPQTYPDSIPEPGFTAREKSHHPDTYSSQKTPLSSSLFSAKSSTTTAQKSINNWLIEDRITPWITASNGLQYRVFRLREKYLNRIDRGKCYDIRYLSTDEQKALQSKLSRHKKVVDLLTERHAA